MCGRYTLRVPMREVAEEFGLFDVPDQPPRYNVAPTQPVPAVRAAAGGRELAMLRWGLIPSWADDPSIGNRMINARAETVATKPAFRAAFKSRRCLVVADGFYEWRQFPGGKQPYLIRLRSGRPFGFAGLWERWDRDGEPLESCTILTTTANELMQPLHDRMPVLIPHEHYDDWLKGDTGTAASLLVPFPADRLTAYPVSRVVNSPRNDVPACVEPVASHA